MSRLITMAALLAALMSSTTQADPTMPPGAQTAVNAYFQALQNADVSGLSELLDGRMKVRLSRLAQNSAYADQLRQSYAGAAFTVGAVEAKPALVLVDYEITGTGERLIKRLYLRQSHDGWRIIAETTVP